MNTAMISYQYQANQGHHVSFGVEATLGASTKPIVFVLDEDASLLESAELLVRREGWHAETFASEEEFLARPRAAVPSCLVLGICLPEFDGLALQKRLAAERSDMPIIFIAGHTDVPTTVQAMKAGAVEFLVKPFREAALSNSMREALERSRVTLGCQAEIQSLRARYSALSRREREVMTLVASGFLNKQVGGELGISEITVKAHRGQVMQKMKANSLAELVRMSTRLGLAAVSPS